MPPDLQFPPHQMERATQLSSVTTAWAKVQGKAPTLTQSPLADVRPGGTTNDELRVIH